MSDAVLVVYVTRYGSTQEVAERVAEVMRENGLQVDVKPARQVRTLEGYRAVVLGAPLYIGRWLKDAHRFLARYQESLAQLPVAVFALGPTRAEEMEGPDVRAQLDQQLSKYPWLKPVAAEMFGGRYDPATLRFPDSLLAALPASPLHGAPSSDARDWEAIRAWAKALYSKLS
ncbi:MAG TPA: flavodoxin [Chloroflexi bacterium]|nr:flavodoxin [Chloroflexota bacterium]